MSTDRKFARFSKTAPSLATPEAPEGGFCISAFVVLTKEGHPNQVLLGRLDTQAPWDHLGAMDADRAQRNSGGWMLPSSHLMLQESPREAATRILREQLGIEQQTLRGPEVFSEVYGPKNHWDLELVFLGERKDVKPTSAWRQLEFVDLTKTKKADMARAHEDILAQVGKRVSDYGAP